MRAIALLAVFVVPAAAEPKQKAKPKPTQADVTLPDVVKELVTGNDRPVIAKDGAIGIDGKRYSGVVVAPPAHPDDEAWPRGAVITPPDPNDPMALELGTNQLRSREKIEAWLPRDLSRAFQRGADQVWDLVLPKL